jgi:hypothetical protein
MASFSFATLMGNLLMGVYFERKDMVHFFHQVVGDGL